MRVGFDRPGGVDGDNLNIVAGTFCDMRKRAAPNTPEAVDADGDGHAVPSGFTQDFAADTRA